MPLDVFQEEVRIVRDIPLMTPAVILNQTREFHSTLRSERFESMEVTLTKINVSATMDNVAVDVKTSVFDVILQLIPCTQTTIHNTGRCKLSAYKDIDLIKTTGKKVVASIDKRGPLVLRCIVKDKDPKNPLTAESLKGFRLKVDYDYAVRERFSSFGNPRASTKAVEDLRSALNRAMNQIRSLSMRVSNSSVSVQSE